MPLLPHASARGSVQGLIRSDGSGLATFNVSYDCVCMRLWPNEVVDAVVEQVTSYGIRCKVGPFRIFVSEKVRRSRHSHVAHCQLPSLCSLNLGSLRMRITC